MLIIRRWRAVSTLRAPQRRSRERFDDGLRGFGSLSVLAQQRRRIGPASVVDDALAVAQRAQVIERVAAQEQQADALARLDGTQIAAPERLRCRR